MCHEYRTCHTQSDQVQILEQISPSLKSFTYSVNAPTLLTVGFNVCRQGFLAMVVVMFNVTFPWATMLCYRI